MLELQFYNEKSQIPNTVSVYFFCENTLDSKEKKNEYKIMSSGVTIISRKSGALYVRNGSIFYEYTIFVTGLAIRCPMGKSCT